MKVDLGTLKLAGVLRGPIRLSLDAGEFLRVEAGEPVRVRCESGRLWITDPGSPQDLWLRGGDSATLDPRRLALIEAVDLTTLSIGRAAAV